MKVYAVTPMYPPTSRVGAWLATHEFLSDLVRRGHQATVWAYKSSMIHTSHQGVAIRPRSVDIDEAIAGASDADVVIGHCGDNGEAAAVARASRRPLVQMYHGGSRSPDPAAALVVYNSEASKRSRPWHGPSIVCHPWTDPQLHQSDTGEHVTLVNCSADKGVAVAEACAIRRPAHRWLAVLGGHGEQVRINQPNVTVVTPTQHMRRDVWVKTRILVMPSVQETWGMVGVEALASGIPVIASDLPGLRESLGDAGTFVHPTDVDGWVAALDRLHDSDEWGKASSRALARSRELAAGDSRPRFAEAVERVAMGAVCTSPS